MNAGRGVECGGCGQAYSSGTWATLAVVRTLTSRDLHAYVSAWEDARVIEVRTCAACGRTLARTRGAAA